MFFVYQIIGNKETIESFSIPFLLTKTWWADTCQRFQVTRKKKLFNVKRFKLSLKCEPNSACNIAVWIECPMLCWFQSRIKVASFWKFLIRFCHNCSSIKRITRIYLSLSPEIKLTFHIIPNKIAQRSQIPWSLMPVLF